MIKKFTFLVLYFLFLQNTFAQEAFYENYDWDKNPSYQVKDYKTNDLVELKSKILTEFYFTKDERFIEYFLEHRALFLNSDARIEEYNKIYLPYSNASELLINKARVITPAGKVITLDESNIHNASDEETGRKYKYFALEGVEKGSVIEYYYVIQKYPDYQGRRISFQENHLKKNVEFDLYAPANLMFTFKSYNGFPEVMRDTLSKEKFHWSAKQNEIPALEDEESSAYDANKSFVVYKLSKNLANNTSGISSYDIFSKRIYENFYAERSRREDKDLEKFLKKIDTNNNQKETIRNLENYIKSNFYISEGNRENFTNLEYILEENVSNDRGIAKLYINALQKLDIPHEIVITSNRFNIAFDPQFESGNFLQEFLIYFPEINAYLSPSRMESRLGYPPAELTDNYGLFIKEVKVGEFKSGAGKIKYIDPLSSEKSYDKMLVEVNFKKDDLTTCQVDIEKSMFGYYALYIQPFLNLMPKESKDNLVNNLAENINEGVELSDSEIINGDPKLFGIKPLTFNLKFSSNNLVEKAGNRYLFKVGKLIGKQMELYQEKERKMPLDEEFKREYYRTITIHIPKGFKIANLEDINLNEIYKEDGKSLMKFTSNYELDGNKLTIKADEFYKTNHLPVGKFENYRKVINSAADFNKIVLVLEPQS